MGNAALCPSCHADKSVRAQGHMQELDKTPDYYGCNSEDTRELEVWVSSKPHTRRRGGWWHKVRPWTSLVHLQTSWKEDDRVKPRWSNYPAASGTLLCLLRGPWGAPCLCLWSSALTMNWHLEISGDAVVFIWNFVQSQRCIWLQSDLEQYCSDSLIFRLSHSSAYLYIHV